MYDYDDISFVAARRMIHFIRNYDGAHVLLMNRSEIARETIPDKPNSRSDPKWIYSDYSPAHYHHNWRFNQVYEKDKLQSK